MRKETTATEANRPKGLGWGHRGPRQHPTPPRRPSSSCAAGRETEARWRAGSLRTRRASPSTEEHNPSQSRTRARLLGGVAERTLDAGVPRREPRAPLRPESGAADGLTDGWVEGRGRDRLARCRRRGGRSDHATPPEVAVCALALPAGAVSARRRARQAGLRFSGSTPPPGPQATAGWWRPCEAPGYVQDGVWQQRPAGRGPISAGPMRPETPFKSRWGRGRGLLPPIPQLLKSGAGEGGFTTECVDRPHSHLPPNLCPTGATLSPRTSRPWVLSPAGLYGGAHSWGPHCSLHCQFGCLTTDCHPPIQQPQPGAGSVWL